MENTWYVNMSVTLVYDIVHIPTHLRISTMFNSHRYLRLLLTRTNATPTGNVIKRPSFRFNVNINAKTAIAKRQAVHLIPLFDVNK